VFGEAPVQRCLRHKERNVTDHLPERDRPLVKQRLRRFATSHLLMFESPHDDAVLSN